MVLEKNDTIGIIALAGDCEREKIEKAVANLERMGYKIKLSKETMFVISLITIFPQSSFVS